jgi:hypothetical protein
MTKTTTNRTINFIHSIYTLPPKTKVQIIQELLDKKAITAEETVTLLQKEVEYITQYYPYYLQPCVPQNPYPITVTYIN